MIHGYSIPNGAKYFTEDGSQKYFVFCPLIVILQHYLTAILLQGENLKDRQIKLLNLLQHEAIFFIKNWLIPTIKYGQDLKIFT